MPVRFHPSKPIELLERYILKDDGSPLEGEIDVYRQLDRDLGSSEIDWDVWHDLKLPVHSNQFNPYRKTSSQVDFLVISKLGVVILEVKGGLISFKDNEFFYEPSGEKMQNPFRQSEGYMHTFREHILNNLNHCLFCYGVVFPFVNYDFSSKLFDKRTLYSKYNSGHYEGSLQKFILSIINHTRHSNSRFQRTLNQLSSNDLRKVKSILSPIINDENGLRSATTKDWLKIDNLEILDGLRKNNRIMIEGPPGSGKTTLAKAFIDQQIGKIGLYLCWNTFLMHVNRKIFLDRGLTNIQVDTFSRFILGIDRTIDPKCLIEASEEEYYEIVKRLFGNLRQQERLPSFDYIIVDEAQDLFDRGIDIVLDSSFQETTGGLNNGLILALYDIDQSYLNSGRNIFEIADILKEYFAHFKLHEIRRSSQSPDIREFGLRIVGDDFVFVDSNMSTANVAIHRFRNLESIKKYIIENILNSIRNPHSSLWGVDCVILVESRLLKDRYRDEAGMRYWLSVRDIEELTEQNINDKSNVLKYTSILKYKGLESSTVVLIITEPHAGNTLEIYVGITRAISKLVCLIVE